MNDQLKLQLKTILIASLVSIVVVSLYHVTTRYVLKPPAYVVINLAEVVEAKEKVFTDMLSKPGITDADRGAAYELVKKFGADMEKEVANIQRDCNCMVFVKGALLAGAEDKTPDLKKRLGL